MRKLPVPALLLGLLGLLAAPDTAPAAACGLIPRAKLVLPAIGAAEVPTNTRIWFGLREDGLRTGRERLDTPVVRVVARDGSEVSTSLNYLWTAYGDAIVVARPDRLLEPKTEYQVYSGETELTSFRTGSGEDHTPPDPPGDRAAEIVMESPDPRCEPQQAAAFHVDHAGDLLLVGRPLSPIMRPDPEGVVTDVVTGTDFTLFSRVHFGEPFRETEDVDAALTFFAADLAANVSDSRDYSLTIPPVEGSALQPGGGNYAGNAGCSSGGSRTTALPLILGALALAWRRRLDR